MSAPDIRYEFSVLDEDYAEQAGGSAPTYAQALDEGQRYLAQYQQDGVHTLELRRVEVLGSTPPATGEVGELVAWLKEQGQNRDALNLPGVELFKQIRTAPFLLTRAADLLEQQQGRISELEAEQMWLKPVPVGERLPDPEDCLIVKNQQWEMRYCWLAKSILHAGEERLVWDWRALPIKISLLVLDDEHWTHWLPANAKLLPARALPIPQEES